jgi:hypothetical protein
VCATDGLVLQRTAWGCDEWGGGGGAVNGVRQRERREAKKKVRPRDGPSVGGVREKDKGDALRRTGASVMMSSRSNSRGCVREWRIPSATN